MNEMEWNIKSVSKDEYDCIVHDTRIFFNESSFAELNKYKVDMLHYLIIYKENSARFALYIGQKGDNGLCPFSAPYAYPVAISNESKIESIESALDTLEKYCKTNGINNIRFIFPPLFYDEHLLSGWIIALYRKNYVIQNLDVNYVIDLKKMNVDEIKYEEIITAKGRKSFRKSKRSGLEIIRCESEEDYKEAYRIVKIGHEYKGFPVKLTFEELMNTLMIVKHDAFIVKKDGVSIVSEFLYQINDNIVQGIYTGTHPDYMQYNGMNYLTYYTIKYYAEKGFSYLDKATSGKNSNPNYGLCNFKESVGCSRTLKYMFYKEL